MSRELEVASTGPVNCMSAPACQCVVMKEKQAAQYIGMSLSFLRQDRMNGTIGQRTQGPIFIKIGRSVRYLKSDLDTWLSEYRVCRQK